MQYVEVEQRDLRRPERAADGGFDGLFTLGRSRIPDPYLLNAPAPSPAAGFSISKASAKTGYTNFLNLRGSRPSKIEEPYGNRRCGSFIAILIASPLARP